MRSLLHLGREQGGVQQQRQVGLADDFVVEQQVPQLETALRIVGRVVEPELLDQAPFAPAGPAAVAVGADDVHLDFARRVAPQPRAVLHQHDLGPAAGRGHGRTDAGQSAAGHQHVAGQIDPLHVRLGADGGQIARRRDAGQFGSDVIGRALESPAGRSAAAGSSTRTNSE